MTPEGGFWMSAIIPKFIKNCFNTHIITYIITKYKVFKFLFKKIFLNDLYYLFSNNFTFMQSNELIKTNKYYF